MIMLYVPGLPQPQGSSRAFVVNGKARITSANGKLKSWRVDVAKVAMDGKVEKLLGPVQVFVSFEFPRPKGHYGTGRNAGKLRDWAPYWHTSKPDADKLLRATLDALTGIAWRDDAQVAMAQCKKRYGERPGTTIVIQEAQE